jgi:hypothetical protein
LRVIEEHDCQEIEEQDCHTQSLEGFQYHLGIDHHFTIGILVAVPAKVYMEELTN